MTSMSVSASHAMLTAYDLWDEIVPALPAREILYEVRLMNLGTGWVEGLHSYLIRLAQAHGTTLTLLMRCLTQPVPPESSVTVAVSPLAKSRATTRASTGSGTGVSTGIRRPRRRRRKESVHLNTVNGTGVWTNRVLAALDRHAVPARLDRMTLVGWQRVLSASQLCHQSMMWCPACFRQWADTGEVLYLPLIWSMRDVIVCSRHAIPLQRECPHCNAQQSLFKVGTQIGVCMHCNASLSSPEHLVHPRPREHGTGPDGIGPEHMPTPTQSWDHWAACTVHELILRTQHMMHLPEANAFARSVKHCLSVSGCSTRQLAEAIGVDPHLINCWLRLVSRPTLAHVLRLSYCFDLPMWQFLDGSIACSTLTVRSLPKHALATRARADQSMQWLKQRLDDYLADEKCDLSLNQISIRLGRSLAFLSHHFPVHYRTLIQRRQSRQPTVSRPDPKSRPQFQAILSCVQALQTLDVHPTQKLVAQAVSMNPGKPRFVEMWRAALSECGYTLPVRKRFDLAS